MIKPFLVIALIERFIKKSLILMIKFYQRTFSFDHGFLKIYYPFGFCRFHPTCSEYAIQALNKYNLLKALYKSIWRVIRCNPWNKGGNDPV